MPRREQPPDPGNPTPQQPRPAPIPRSSAVGGLFALGKWLVLGAGLMIALVAFFQGTVIEAAALAGLACFLGIVARVFQAEEHRLLKCLVVCTLFTPGNVAAAKTNAATVNPPAKAEPKKDDPPPALWTDWVKFEHADGKAGYDLGWGYWCPEGATEKSPGRWPGTEGQRPGYPPSPTISTPCRSR